MAWEASGPGRGRWQVFCHQEGCDAELWSCVVWGASPSHCLRAQGWQKARNSSNRYCPRHAWGWQPPDTELLWCEHRQPQGDTSPPRSSRRPDPGSSRLSRQMQQEPSISSVVGAEGLVLCQMGQRARVIRSAATQNQTCLRATIREPGRTRISTGWCCGG